MTRMRVILSSDTGDRPRESDLRSPDKEKGAGRKLDSFSTGPRPASFRKKRGFFDSPETFGKEASPHRPFCLHCRDLQAGLTS